MATRIIATGNIMLNSRDRDGNSVPITLASRDGGDVYLPLTLAQEHRAYNNLTRQWETDQRRGREGTTWWDLAVFGGAAEGLYDVIAKAQDEGRKSLRVVVEGEPSVDVWSGKDGVRRYTARISRATVSVVPTRPAANNGGSQASQGQGSDPWAGGEGGGYDQAPPF